MLRRLSIGIVIILGGAVSSVMMANNSFTCPSVQVTAYFKMVCSTQSTSSRRCTKQYSSILYIPNSYSNSQSSWSYNQSSSSITGPSSYTLSTTPFSGADYQSEQCTLQFTGATSSVAVSEAVSGGNMSFNNVCSYQQSSPSSGCGFLKPTNTLATDTLAVVYQQLNSDYGCSGGYWQENGNVSICSSGNVNDCPFSPPPSSISLGS